MAYISKTDTSSKRGRRRDRHASKPYRPTNTGKPGRLESGGGR